MLILFVFIFYVTEIVQQILSKYYGPGKRNGSLLHCTAKYMGYRGQAVGAKAYHGRKVVQDSVGKAFLLEIPSICFSPRTVGARVQLSQESAALFDKPEERDWNGRQPVASNKGYVPSKGQSSPSQNSCSSDSVDDSGTPNRNKRESGGGEGHKNGKSPNKRKEENGSQKMEDGANKGHGDNDSSNWSQSDSCLRPSFTKPVAKMPNRSAHITIGLGQGFESRETNFDVLRLCDLEVLQRPREEDFVPVTGGKARYFGDGVCCVYLEPPLRATTLYSGSY
jgi:hypothetical protein